MNMDSEGFHVTCKQIFDIIQISANWGTDSRFFLEVNRGVLERGENKGSVLVCVYELKW